jgi:hypothetical protein
VEKDITERHHCSAFSENVSHNAKIFPDLITRLQTQYHQAKYNSLCTFSQPKDRKYDIFTNKLVTYEVEDLKPNFSGIIIFTL